LGSGSRGTVYALAFGPDGSLYTGGWFDTAGGVAANGIARWDGAQWHPLGSGSRGTVYALAFGPDGSLYAGGRFLQAAGVMVGYVDRWDGSQWHPLGSGMSRGDHAEVLTLVFGPNGSLYAGGWFDTAGGVAANYIARWDGAQWHPLGSSMNGGVYALAFGPDGSLYVGGWFTTAGGVVANHIARWDGVQWHSLGSGMNYNGVCALAFGPDGLLYAGGDFTTAGGIFTKGIARWDSTGWHAVATGSGMNSSIYTLAVGPNRSLYAGGWFTAAGVIAANRIARWDGAQWHPLGSGMEGPSYHGAVRALASGPDGSLYAGGDFNIAGGVAANGIARWDGAEWHPLGSGMGGTSVPDVRALAFGPDGSLYAGGVFTTAGGIAANYIARWDGAQWHPLGSGMGGSSYYPGVSALAFGPDGSLYAGGVFDTAGGATANRIARWDGAQWYPLGSGMGGTSAPDVRDLAFGPDGSLYAGGIFTTAGGIAANYIARWDGVQWHPLDGGISGDSSWVRALAVGPNGSLYAGGNFTTAGGVAANRIARWDGTQWYSLGSGMDGISPDVKALAFSPDGSLYAGGGFTTAGGKPSSNIARWTKGVVQAPVAWFPAVLIDQ
jgi:WD40 repeat protein